MELSQFYCGRITKSETVLFLKIYVYNFRIFIFRNLPLAILISTTSVTVIYVLTNIALYVVISPEDMKYTPAVAVVSMGFVQTIFDILF